MLVSAMYHLVLTENVTTFWCLCKTYFDQTLVVEIKQDDRLHYKTVYKMEMNQCHKLKKHMHACA